MRIVVDAMGTDARPVNDVEGGVMAAREFKDTIIFVGDKPRIEAELKKHDISGLSIEIVHAEDEIVMVDKPTVVIKSKPQSSMHIGMNLVKDGQADAFVSGGNTGAMHAIGTLKTLKRIKGIERPALTAIYPVNGKNVILLDVGANPDSKVEWLEQFALMGSVYAKTALGIDNPRVATLSNGAEEEKGNELVKAAFERLGKLPINYLGHVEPKEMTKNYADVLVMDGYVGNIFIKAFEAAIAYFTETIRQELTADLQAKVGGLLARPAFRRVRSHIDPREVGGAPLLGLNGLVIKAHGGSDAYSVRSAILQARRAIAGNTVEEIRKGLAQVSATVNEN
jgi:glycerol-3-phosphate acyltransferase PlsX